MPVKPAVADIDIIRAAKLVIEMYPDPMLHAAGRYDELLDKGDLDGCSVWQRIMTAISELQAVEPTGPVH